MQNNLEKDLHISTYIIVYKFLLGFIELLLGLGILIYGKTVVTFYESFRSQELLEDPNDLFIQISQKLLPFILEHQGYIVLILILLGAVKMIGSVGLFYRKHWGLDVLVGLTVLILPFELYNLFISPTILKVVFFIINILISLYLVEFQPKSYYYSFKERIQK